MATRRKNARRWRSLDLIWPTFIGEELPLTSAQRKDIHREAWRRWMKRPINLLLYALLPVIYGIGVTLGREAADWFLSWLGMGGLAHRLARIGILIIIPLFCFVLGGIVLQRRRFAPLVYQIMREWGYNICLKCGYWLRGLPASEKQCPECGAQRAPVSGDY